MNSTAHETNAGYGLKKGYTQKKFSAQAFEDQLNTDGNRASLKSSSAMGIYQKDSRGKYEPINPLNYQGGGYSTRNDFGVRHQSNTGENFAAYSKQTLDAIQPGLASRVDKM